MCFLTEISTFESCCDTRTALEVAERIANAWFAFGLLAEGIPFSIAFRCCFVFRFSAYDVLWKKTFRTLTRSILQIKPICVEPLDTTDSPFLGRGKAYPLASFSCQDFWTPTHRLSRCCGYLFLVARCLPRRRACCARPLQPMGGGPPTWTLGAPPPRNPPLRSMGTSSPRIRCVPLGWGLASKLAGMFIRKGI